MKIRALWLVTALCVLCLCGCQIAVDPTTAPTESFSTHSTTPSVSISPEREPVVEAPARTQLPADFFSDAAFVGDSVTYGLMLECMRTGDLKDALFLATKSMGLTNSLFGGFTHSYQGQSMTTEEALAASGVKKVFIMLGMNDLSAYSPEVCVGHWSLLTTRILEKCPDIEIYIQSGTPIYTGSEHDNLTNANMDAYNALLKAFAEDNDFHYVDIAFFLKDQTGGIAHRYCSDDYVHLTSLGAQVWIAVLENYITQQGAKNE